MAQAEPDIQPRHIWPQRRRKCHWSRVPKVWMLLHPGCARGPRLRHQPIRHSWAASEPMGRRLEQQLAVRVLKLLLWREHARHRDSRSLPAIAMFEKWDQY